MAEAKPYQPSGKPQAAAEGKRVGGRLSPPADRRLLYAADGSGRGLCIALSFAFGIKAFEVKDTTAALMQIGGGSAFALMVPVLAGFIAFSIADRPGLTRALSAVCWRLAAAPALSAGSSLVSPVMCESHQHEAETAAEYGSPEANPDHSAGLQPDRGLAMII